MELEEREIYFMKRRRLGITSLEIAEKLGVNQSSISRYEAGKINFRFADDYKNYIDNKEKEINKI